MSLGHLNAELNFPLQFFIKAEPLIFSQTCYASSFSDHTGQLRIKISLYECLKICGLGQLYITAITGFQC